MSGHTNTNREKGKKRKNTIWVLRANSVDSCTKSILKKFNDLNEPDCFESLKNNSYHELVNLPVFCYVRVIRILERHVSRPP